MKYRVTFLQDEQAFRLTKDGVKRHLATIPEDEAVSIAQAILRTHAEEERKRNAPQYIRPIEFPPAVREQVEQWVVDVNGGKIPQVVARVQRSPEIRNLAGITRELFPWEAKALVVEARRELGFSTPMDLAVN